MKMIKLSCFFIIILISCKQTENNVPTTQEIIKLDSVSKKNGTSSNLEFDYLPTSTTNDIYFKKGYAFSYAEDYEQSEWVAYELNLGKWKYNTYERPMFDQDLEVKEKSAHWKNFKKSGYTKGHLCPAGDRKETQELFNETFITSNVSPQLYEFNDGVWNRLEQKTRYWAEKYNGLYVITGGVLTNDLETIGTEEVAVPKYFYKVLMTKDQQKMIAFLVPHEDSTKALYEFVVSVDELEKLTKIDFFTTMDDAKEVKLEKTNDYKEWSFK